MERAPTYEEVQAFAQSEGLDSKTNVSKFYEYYSRFGFIYKGVLMDWKTKLKKWAETETAKPSKVQPAAVKRKYDVPTEEYWAKVEKEMERWGK